MKKRILSYIAAFSIILLLMAFALIYNQYSSDGNSSFSPQDSCDALILIQSDGYNVKLTSSPNEQPSYRSLFSNEDSFLHYHENLSLLIGRKLSLNDENVCHYGLFEKDSKQFAVFYSNIIGKNDAELLCHLLRCYLDYFPVLLVGTFDSDSLSLITDICKMSVSTDNGVTYLTSCLSANSNEERGTLSFSIKKTTKSLDLNKKMIALTYDDGPDIYTSQIVATLNAYNAKATFFVNGSHVTDHPDAIKDIFESTHEIGNHTNLHEMFNRNTQGIIRKTIEETNKKIRNIVGIGAKMVRPPGGETLDRYQKPVILEYPIIRWSLDTLDYEGNKDASVLLQTIKSQAKHGDIVLMHDSKAITATACDSIVSYLTSQGFQLVSVSELLEFATEGAQNNIVYNNAYPSNS